MHTYQNLEIMIITLQLIIRTNIGREEIHSSISLFIIICPSRRLTSKTTGGWVYTRFISDTFQNCQIFFSTIRQRISHFIKLASITGSLYTTTDIQVKFPVFNRLISKLCLIVNKLVFIILTSTVFHCRDQRLLIIFTIRHVDRT